MRPAAASSASAISRPMPRTKPVPSVESLKLKDPKDFRYIGKGQISIVDLHDITIGTAHYGSDTRLPGMKYAVIARPPVIGGKLVSFDAAAAHEGPGRREGDGGDRAGRGRPSSSRSAASP